jgi:hypothetical protein
MAKKSKAKRVSMSAVEYLDAKMKPKVRHDLQKAINQG